MTAPPETITADPYTFTAPGGPYIVAEFNGKGGQGKTTDTMGLAARSAELGMPTVALDTDPQANTYDTAKAMGPACPYTPVHETDPAQLAQLRDFASLPIVATHPGTGSGPVAPQRIYVDTPGNLERLDVIGEILNAVDLAIVPYDASPLATRPTFRTLGLLAGAGVPTRVLLNNIPSSHSTAMILGHWKALDAAVYCTRCGIDRECDECDVRRGVRAFNLFIRSYAPWQRAVEVNLPVTAYKPKDEYAGRVRDDLAALFLAVELELAKPRAER